MSNEKPARESASGKTESLICERCRVSLAPAPIQFRYLKRGFKHEVMRCPQCGQVYIPEDLAEGRMREVETALEDK